MNISRRSFLKLSCLAALTVTLTGKQGCKLAAGPPDSTDLPDSPKIDTLEKEIDTHLEKNKKLNKTFELYKGVLAVHLAYIDKIEVPLPLTKTEIIDLFKRNQYVLSQHQLKFDPTVFKEILHSIIGVMEEKNTETPESLANLPDTQEFEKDNIQEFLNKTTPYDKVEMERYIQKIGMDKRTGVDKELISFVTFTSTSPFYKKCREVVTGITDFYLWQQGFCPVCGQTSTIAKHRQEDGARIMECWLCHAQWYHPRMECPYCDNNDQKKLRFFYIGGDNTRQVHICQVCNRYLKVIDGRAMESETILEVEDIATGYLDVLAQREGYNPPAQNRSVLY